MRAGGDIGGIHDPRTEVSWEDGDIRSASVRANGRNPRKWVSDFGTELSSRSVDRAPEVATPEEHVRREREGSREVAATQLRESVFEDEAGPPFTRSKSRGTISLPDLR